jgi:hypothetical protein
MADCLFDGGQVAIDGEEARMDHCTLLRQTVRPVGSIQHLALTNSIVWQQAAGPQSPGNVVVSSCIVDHIGQWPAGQRMMEIDPQLDAEGRPRANSRAIDAGDTTASLSDLADSDGDGNTAEALPFDLAGASRFRNDAGTFDTGVGTSPFSDLGAYEFQGFSCSADFDGDGFVTGADFDLFVQAFEIGDMLADFDRDGFLTGVDFDLFSGRFEEGC